MTSDFSEIVKVTWDYSQPLDKIGEMMRKLDELDAKMSASGQSAAQRFSQGFAQGLTGATEAIALLEQKLQNVLSKSTQITSSLGAARGGGEQLGGGFVRDAQGQIRSSTTGRFAQSQYEAWLAGNAPEPTAAQRRSISADFPFGIQGGSGAFDYMRGDQGPGYDYRLERQRELALRWEQQYGRQLHLGDASRSGRGLNFFPSQLDPSGQLDQQYPLPGLGLPSFYEALPQRSRQQPLPGFQKWQGQMEWFGNRSVPVSHDAQANRAMAEMAADMDEQIQKAMIEESLRRLNLMASQNQYANWVRTQGPSRFAQNAEGLFTPSTGAGDVVGSRLWDQFRGQPVSQSSADYDAARSAQGRADYEQWRLGTEAARNYEKQVTAAGTAISETGQKVEGFTDRFSRHLTWIAQGIAIWGALNLTSALVRDFTDELLRLESVQSRLSFITGQTAQQTGRQFDQAAGYGFTSAEAGQGLITAGQLDLSTQQRTQGLQLARVFGKDQLENIYQELYQTEQRANAAGIGQIETLDYMATAYANVSGTAETYFDSLQYGIELHRYLGLSAEQAAIAIGEMANALETDPSQVKNLLSRITLQIDKPEVRDELKNLGISGPTVPEYIQQIAQGVAGGGQRAEDIIGQMSFGLQGAQQKTEFRVLFQSFSEYMTLVNSGQADLRSFGDLQSNIVDDGVTKIDRLKAAWSELMRTLGEDTPALDFISGPLEGLTGQIERMGTLADAFKRFGTQSPIENLRQAPDLYNFLTQEAANNPDQVLSGLGGWINIFADAVKRFEISVRRTTGAKPGPVPEAEEELALYPKGMGPNMGSRRLRNIDNLKNEPPDFGGFDTFPKGMDWDQFVRRVGEFENQLQREVPEYDLNRQTMAFYDESAGYYRKITGDNEAIRRALEEQTDLLKTITGVFNVPAGGEILVPFAALQAGFVPNYGGENEKGGAGKLDTSGFSAATGKFDLTTSRMSTITTKFGASVDRFSGAIANIAGKEDREGGKDLPGVPKGSNNTMHKRQLENDKTVATLPPITIQLRNVIMLNSRILQDEISKMMRRAQTATRSGTTGGAGSNQLLT